MLDQTNFTDASTTPVKTQVLNQSQNTSTLSKKWKSAAWKAKKRSQHHANVELRRSLNSQRAATSDSGKRAEIQKQIDMISLRGKHQG